MHAPHFLQVMWQEEFYLTPTNGVEQQLKYNGLSNSYNHYLYY
jgi:hypothetical protein